MKIWICLWLTSTLDLYADQWNCSVVNTIFLFCFDIPRTSLTCRSTNRQLFQGNPKPIKEKCWSGYIWTHAKTMVVTGVSRTWLSCQSKRIRLKMPLILSSYYPRIIASPISNCYYQFLHIGKTVEKIYQQLLGLRSHEMQSE